MPPRFTAPDAGVTRRQALSFAGAALVAGSTAARSFAQPAAAPPPHPAGGKPPALVYPGSLASLAAAKGMRFGTALGLGGLADPAYSALVLQESALITPENELKWQATHPAPDRFDFAPVDRLFGWAGAHNVGVRGHTLLWNRDERFPPWFAHYDFGADKVAGARKLVADHIYTVAHRYAGRVESFDVVNETIDPDTGTFRDNILNRLIGGDALIDLAFHTAREAAPQTPLVYNDYMGWEDANDRHRTGVLRLLEGMRKRGTPCDALGLQSHLIVPDRETPAEAAKRIADWRRFVDEVVGMGYAVLITEFDVDDYKLPADIATRDRRVADYGGAYLDLMFSYPQLRTVMCWGLSDRNTWLQTFRERADHLPKRTCPYDAALRPTPLRAAMARAFEGAPRRPA